MGHLDELGIRPVINAAGAYTMLGGSRLAPGVAAAMADVSDTFLDLDLLQRRVGGRIAELTRNEACFVASGAAAGVAIAIAACVAGTDPGAIDGFPVAGTRDVVIQASHRNGYDYSARMTGVRLAEVGAIDRAPSEDELRAAIGPSTACVLFFAGPQYEAHTLAVESVVAVARAAEVPVVVDAAGQVPPVANLWRYTVEAGADLTIFSGGKGIRGPQTTGLVLGRPDLVEACIANANPRHSLGRPMKVGKEELLGILAAVEWTVRQDEAALVARWERLAERWVAGLGGGAVPGAEARRGFPGLHDNVPQCIVKVPGWTAVERDAFVAALKTGDPPVAIRAGTAADEIQLNPMFVREGEGLIVLDVVREALRREVVGRG